MKNEVFVQSTRSVCPHCLQNIEAEIVQRGEEVFLRRECPHHGMAEECIWRGAPAFTEWKRPKTYNSAFLRQSESHEGCPQDCGLCSQHLQKSCAVLYELTDACNLRCPVCFASSGEKRGESFGTLEEHVQALRWIAEQAGQAVLQLSGGEPTLSPWLFPLVREAAALFPAVQLNTNGLILAKDKEYAIALAEAGLSWVFLQFDGLDESIYTQLRGRELLDIKLQAIEHCRAAGLAVVLVPTVAKGINDHVLGEIVRFGIKHAPTVRGVHFQPMTRAGRNTLTQNESFTLPEVLQALETQTEGMIALSHASPPGCEHERCSFHCRYSLKDGTLTHTPSSCCCAGGGEVGQERVFSEKAEYLQGRREESDEGANKAIASVVQSWQKAPSEKGTTSMDSFDAFIARHRATLFSVTCMAFQDVWNLDIQRLQGCCIHIYAPPNRLIPFCAYNLTNDEGHPLHRKTAAP